MVKNDQMIKDGLKEMEQILKNVEVGRLALCDNSLKPYIIPLNFIYHRGKIAFHCAWKGKKLDIIAKNPLCCFEVDKYMGEIEYHHETQCNLDYDSVLAYGRAYIEKDPDEKVRLLQLFAEKYSVNYRKPLAEGGKRFDKSRITECCCITIEIQELTGRRERTHSGKPKKTMWHYKF